MGTKRPYKVSYVYDAGPCRAREIKGTRSSHELCTVRKTARTVSRNGGRAVVWTTDATTGEQYDLARYQPFEVAMTDLVEAALAE